ncbi:unnamed protein product [Medioppia subpectinata]|uniref:Carboxylic ester hydrolase n=1 Tax=Medioppia subpectinata TaxID=1979941 RepID=A0A7R9L353_9ACAR|nr:unnamed protein product [Medioppia subpectinata]CAG2113520.1 unnamed protein product [Medioppia subpectinata]
MKDRKPFVLRKIIMIYNFILVVINAYFVYASIGWLDYGHKSWLTRLPARNEWSEKAIAELPAKAVYAYSKLFDLFDTVFFVLRKKLNTFGFLYTGTDVGPGNMGLWDQALALQWVSDNIQHFGGDASRITLFGQSAGGWSASLHILSPVSRHLFQNAILMSGSAINRNAGEPAGDVALKWLKGAQAIGCTPADKPPATEFTPEIIECFQRAPAETLAAIPFMPTLMEGVVGWNTVVVVDGEFLPDLPLKMLNSGDHKHSVNSPPAITYTEAYNELSRISRKMWSKEPIDGELAAKVYFNGLSNESPDDLLRQTIGIAVGDYILSCPGLQFGRTLFENDPDKTRVYQYLYNSKLGRPKLVCSNWAGVCHLDDIYPVFGVPFYQADRFVDGERHVSAKVINIFSTFAKTGQPPPQESAHWDEYYRLNNYTITPYYEITSQPKPVTNFGAGYKIVECEYLWKKLMPIIALIGLTITATVRCDDSPVVTVQTANGIVNGRSEHFDGREYNVFLGVPYAEPPVGGLRFKKPVPVQSWSEPRETSQWPAPCHQTNPFLENFNNKVYSEDCLYLNIWSPVDSKEDSETEPKAVMFWIHGGALLVGSALENFYSGHVLATKGDVVVVTVEYR